MKDALEALIDHIHEDLIEAIDWNVAETHGTSRYDAERIGNVLHVRHWPSGRTFRVVIDEAQPLVVAALPRE